MITNSTRPSARSTRAHPVIISTIYMVAAG
jgi:hypothetical protein